jgi:predicted DCC family thiol-disulfide oxidoreductase YuxK
VNISAISNPVVFFDGVCNLCDHTVQFIIRHDKRQQFRFAALQSPLGAEFMETHSLKGNSVVLYYKGRYYQKSAAAIKIATLLGGGWSLLAAGYILPRFLRDAVYDLVAKNRYKWFGKHDACMIPGPGVRSLFLSE